MFIYSKLKIFFNKPGQYFRYKTKPLRKIYYLLSKYLHFKTFYSRVYKKNFLSSDLKKYELIDVKEGYKLISQKELSNRDLNINQLLDKIHNDLNNIDLSKFKNSNDGIINLKKSKDYDCESPEFKFVTNKYLIEVVSRYLKCVPILTNLSLWYSPNDKIYKNSSQEYHLDHEDYRQVKGFLFINEIDLQTGPLNIINNEQSNNIQKLINYRMTKSDKRVNDQIIQDLKNKKININENTMTGKSGDLLLCDTSSCFHYGSRLGNKPRFILAFQYVTPFGFSLDWNWKNYDKIPFKDLECKENSLIRKVLGNEI
tara:strand:- start:506 stop:1444 length:939 start_codon:yes stop_codon:yes gene_type:complete